MSAKSYAMWGGIILLVLGVLGFVISGNTLFGLNSDPVEDIIHVVAGLILVYFGFRGTDAQAATWAMVFGVIFLVVGVIGFIPGTFKTIFGLLPTGLNVLDNIVHLIYGVVGVWAGRAYKPAM
jgi:hypothetical protein